MRKNSFGETVILVMMVIGIFLLVGMICDESAKNKCILKGCDNKRAPGSSYCYLHKSYGKTSSGSYTKSSGTKSSGASSNSTSGYSNSYKKSSGSYSGSKTGTSGGTYSGSKSVRKRAVITTATMMAMTMSIWTVIMIMTDMTEIPTMRTE